MSEHCRYLLTGGAQRQLLPALRRALTHATEIDIAVSFIRSSGLNLLFSDLEAAISADDRTVRLRLLTSDYLHVTEPQALKRLLLLAERGADIRIFKTQHTQAFHLKAYIFVTSKNGEMMSADAFVGSSNISASALTQGLEWNYHLDYPNQADALAAQRLDEIRREFQQLLDHERVSPLTYEWIQHYESRYREARKVTPIRAAAIDPTETEFVKPEPREHQVAALAALADARRQGQSKGLVVMATGLGKTYVAAFDAANFQAQRILFVAHREEILLQAEDSFLAVMPDKRIGRYTGSQKDTNCDVLFASIQTLGREVHLSRFAPVHFDYLVVDEFHHAAAGSYQRLLNYFTPRFLLGLTATPDRTDQSDILRLCGHNEIYRRDLFKGIQDQQLSPFHYYGIFDSEVDYEHIPWRNGRFDPNRLSNKLATSGRARHALKEWREKAQSKTLAFCASKSHADFMANYFRERDVRASSVHTDSDLTRSEALEQLSQGELDVLFSVDLFNEGVDLPSIDTVMMLRPTESRILFLQQLGRGLRRDDGKEKLVVLDFVGNHHSFLNRPEMLLGSQFSTRPTRQQIVDAAKNANALLPDGCFVNYDLAFIEFLDSLLDGRLDVQYARLKATLGKRPTLVEFWRSGANLTNLRKQYGSWWEFVDEQGDAAEGELQALEHYVQWFRDLSTTSLSKSYKLVLLQTLLDSEAMQEPIALRNLAEWSAKWYRENPDWLIDLPENKRSTDQLAGNEWLAHWRRNPIKFWCTAEQSSGIAWFTQEDLMFRFSEPVVPEIWAEFRAMTAEVLDWRFAHYKKHRLPEVADTSDAEPVIPGPEEAQLSFFPDIKIACGYFKTGKADQEWQVRAPSGLGKLVPEKHFIARASGDSMNGGKNPILDGDYLLLERVSSVSAGGITGDVMAVERQDAAGDNQYLLRKVLKNDDGSYTLKAFNPDYPDLIADDSMVTFARLKGRVNALEIFVGHEFMREDIPGLFGVEFNPGNWQSGHVVLADQKAHVLLVTLNKQGAVSEHQYVDHFMGDRQFHWQSQNQTSPESSRGRGLIHHQRDGVKVYLFVREHKLRNKKAAPFHFYGQVRYLRHTGSQPMSIIWELCESTVNL